METKFNFKSLYNKRAVRTPLDIRSQKETADMFYAYYKDRIGYDWYLVPGPATLGDNWNIYFALYDSEFKKANGIDYLNYDVFDNIEELANYILKYPKIGKIFLSEVKSYNFEF